MMLCTSAGCMLIFISLAFHSFLLLFCYLFYLVPAPSLRAGVQSMIHATGLGKMRPNTVVMGFKNNWTDKRCLSEVGDYLGVITDVLELSYGLIILRMNEKHKKKFFVDKVNEESAEGLTSLENISATASENAAIPQLLTIALKEKQRGTIDVWWLYDDGGLTVLIPYLLTLHRAWKNCKLRFFSADIRSKYEFNPQGLRMAKLLKKFRIDASCVKQTDEVNTMPSKESIDAFRRLPVGEELGEKPIEDQKVLRTIRIGELVRQNCSEDTRLVVISIPVPVTDVTTPLMYMSWLEVMSADLPPVLLVRGNQTNVLTFYS